MKQEGNDNERESSERKKASFVEGGESRSRSGLDKGTQLVVKR